jgi:hypothetical protein
MNKGRFIATLSALAVTVVTVVAGALVLFNDKKDIPTSVQASASQNIVDMARPSGIPAGDNFSANNYISSMSGSFYVSSVTSSYSYWFSIVPSTTAIFNIYTSGGSGDPELLLYSYNGSSVGLLDTNDDYSSDNHARISYTLTANSTYFIRARAYTGTASYYVYVADALNSSYYLMTSNISWTTGTVNTMLIYFVPTSSYSSLTIETTNGSRDNDPKLTLYSYSYGVLTQLSYNDDINLSGGNYNARVSAAVTMNRPYILKVWHYAKKKGTVIFKVPANLSPSPSAVFNSYRTYANVYARVYKTTLSANGGSGGTSAVYTRASSSTLYASGDVTSTSTTSISRPTRSGYSLFTNEGGWVGL